MTGAGGLQFKNIAAEALGRAESLVSTWLPDGSRQGDEWVARNPHRDDRKAGSFSVNLKTGVWREFAGDDGGSDLLSLYAFLFTGNSQKEAAVALGREVGISVQRPSSTPRKAVAPRPALPVPTGSPAPPAKHFELGAHTGEWIYRSPGGEELYRVRRYDSEEGKEYRPLSFKDGKWTWGYPSEPRPLYGLERLADVNKSTVLVVEGEKAADAAARLFPTLAVVTSPAGAKAARKADWTPLQGRQVVIWPDHDPVDPNTGKAPGLEFAGDVNALLKELGVVARVVDVPKAWPEKWDLADQVPAGVGPFTLQEMIDQAGPWAGAPGADGPVEPLCIIDTSEWGIRPPPPLLWVLKGAIPQGQPGIWAGRSNAGKSLGAIQLGHNVALGHGLWGLEGPGGPMFTLYVSMEDGKEELERRWDRNLDLLKEDHPNWSAEQIHLVRQNFIPMRPNWNASCAKTLPRMVDQIKRTFDAGRPTSSLPGLILLDTLAALAEGEENSAEAHQAFWAACHNLTDATGATVVALHHSKKPLGLKPPSMSDRMSFDFIRGSSAIVAGARFVLQMEPLTREEAEKLGLDGDRAAAGNFPILGLSKQVSGPKGDWILLEQRQSHEVGGGFFTPHPDSEHLVAQSKGKGATKKLNLLEAILVDVHRGIHDRKELARRNYPDLPPEEGEAKLTQALKDMRRKTRGWIQAGGMVLTANGFLKAQALCLAEDIRSGSASTLTSTPEDDGASNDAA